MGEFAGGAGIVGAIDVNVGGGLQFFEAAGPDCVGDALRDCIAGDLKATILEKPRGGYGVQGVLELKTAWEAWGQLEDFSGVRFDHVGVDAAFLDGFLIDAK